MGILESIKILKTTRGSFSTLHIIQHNLLKPLSQFLITCYNRALQAAPIYWRTNHHLKLLADFYLWI